MRAYIWPLALAVAGFYPAYLAVSLLRDFISGDHLFWQMFAHESQNLLLRAILSDWQQSLLAALAVALLIVAPLLLLSRRLSFIQNLLAVLLLPLLLLSIAWALGWVAVMTVLYPAVVLVVIVSVLLAGVLRNV